MVSHASLYTQRLMLLAILVALAITGWLFQSAETVVASGPTPTPAPKTSSTNPSAAPSNQTYTVFLPFIRAVAPPAPTYKKGASLATGFESECSGAQLIGAYWLFNWTQNPPTSCPGIESIPMIWDETYVNSTLGGNSNWILGFNEPDAANQANLSITEAAQLWRQIEQKYPTRKLVAPAPSGDIPTWIESFYNEYKRLYITPPRLDALAVHCYAWAASECISHTQKFITWANNWGVSEVWVTEFAFATERLWYTTTALEEESAYINWMQTQSKVTRFAWYATKGASYVFHPYFQTQLVNRDTGQLTSYGSLYTTFK